MTSRSDRTPTNRKRSPPRAFPPTPAEAALSFLKDTKGLLTWSVRDLAETLRVHHRDAEAIVRFLEAQGYVKPGHGPHVWMTTPAGESLSGAKAPRFTRPSVEEAIAALKKRIKRVNQDPNSPYRITEAVAFGDFLLKDRVRVQPAEAGIQLERRGQADEPPTASSVQAEQEFLRELRGRRTLVIIRPYTEWMRKRSHLELL